MKTISNLLIANEELLEKHIQDALKQYVILGISDVPGALVGEIIPLIPPLQRASNRHFNRVYHLARSKDTANEAVSALALFTMADPVYSNVDFPTELNANLRPKDPAPGGEPNQLSGSLRFTSPKGDQQIFRVQFVVRKKI